MGHLPWRWPPIRAPPRDRAGKQERPACLLVGARPGAPLTMNYGCPSSGGDSSSHPRVSPNTSGGIPQFHRPQAAQSGWREHELVISLQRGRQLMATEITY